MAQRMNGELVAVHVIPQDGLAAPTAELLERQRELARRARRELPRGRRRGHRRCAPRRGALAERDADRDGREPALAVAAPDERLGHREGDPRAPARGSTSTSSATRTRPRKPSRSRVPAGRPRCRSGASRSGFVLAVVGPPVLAYVLSHLREQIGLPSVLLLFLLLVVWTCGARRPLAGASRRRQRHPARQLVLHSAAATRSRSSDGENILALVVFLAVATTVSLFVDLAARRSVQGRRAQAEAEALARLAGSAPVEAVLDSLRRVLNAEGAAVLHRTESGWRIEATSGGRIPTTARRPATTTIELDDDHVLVLAGRPIRAEDQRVLEAFAKELEASVELGELEAEVQGGGSRLGRERASRRDPLRGLARPPHAALRRSRRR